ncbi:TIM-barrel domain-containing protein [Cerasicoccus arenae]|uniref:Alpha-glucosidase n=1 Tax=Cerasicoccus arenae TaxID=424488 RepID=A0A8J3DB70_9BACT|nr:TIM-barrel domain-containing protein [Cerasicoccus arenae]MBK1857210.1 DUF5110 domain-containing protein [Cerasicoccus arenae]GHC00018.1 alpha-glucosidase [Cerasicoccus arenae]
MNIPDKVNRDFTRLSVPVFLQAIAFCLCLLVSSNAWAARRSVAIEQQAEISDGIALFVPDGYSANLTPSMALAKKPELIGALPRDWMLVPEFFDEDGHAGASLRVPAGSSLYGTGEVTGPLLRNGKSIKLWNTDNYGYSKDGGQRLYQSHPWVLGVRPDGSAFGVLFDSSWKAELATKDDEIVFETEGSAFQVVVIDRESPQAVVRGLAEMTGTMPLPPKWALGFQQCRYSYYPDAKVREIADEFRQRRLPCDVIWMDIHYMDGFRVFTFDPNHFPDPKATNDYLHEKGFHSVWMIDPGVKIDPNYDVYRSGSRENIWVETKRGDVFEGKVWPGECVFPDFTMPTARKWWADQYQDFMAMGVDGVWNDMNEPSVFDTPDGTMPEDNWHRGGGILPAGPHKLYHNVYGMLMTAASRDGIQRANPDRRPFVLTRANFVGGQRFAATWTGDNGADMSFLETSVPMSLNLGLSGQPMSGPDIGGFIGDIDGEQFARWIVMAPFYPFARAHTSVDNPPREPWAFGPEVEQVSRTALERRYRFMPYLYTLVFKASQNGDPIMQPVFFADPEDMDLRAEDDAFLLGPDVLVVPQWAKEPQLPDGIWRSFSVLDSKEEQDGFQPSVYVRGGAILPLGRVIQNTNERSLNPLTLIVCLDENEMASGDLYEDAGEGYGYQKNEYVLTRYFAKREGDEVVVRLDNRRGGVQIPDRKVHVKLVSAEGVYEGSGREVEGIVISVPALATIEAL